MKVICLSQDGSKRASFCLNPWTHLIIPALLIALLIGGLSINQIVGLYQLDNTPQQAKLSEEETTKILTSLEQQLSTVEYIKEKYSNYTVDVEALTKKLGALEAETLRLRALGARIVKMAKLDPDEFTFDLEPGRGGFDYSDGAFLSDKVSTAADLMKSVDSLEQTVTKEKEMLKGMSQIIQGRILDKEVKPSAKPVTRGYVSSPFGFRRDPFNGRTRMHKGIDFAGRSGTKIFTVAAGVVSYVGRKGGYGNVVEVDHGDGLISRYAHLKASLVKVGEVVKKSDLIAEMGSSGRSTGSHLHLEVLQHGEHVNPSDFLGQYSKK